MGLPGIKQWQLGLVILLLVPQALNILLSRLPEVLQVEVPLLILLVLNPLVLNVNLPDPLLRRPLLPLLLLLLDPSDLLLLTGLLSLCLLYHLPLPGLAPDLSHLGVASAGFQTGLPGYAGRHRRVRDVRGGCCYLMPV